LRTGREEKESAEEGIEKPQRPDRAKEVWGEERKEFEAGTQVMLPK